MFWLQTFILVSALVLVLAGIWYEDKLIAFEKKFSDRFCDRVGYIIAKIVLIYRSYRIKRAMKNIDRAIQKLDKEEGIIEKIRGRKFNDRRSKQ